MMTRERIDDDGTVWGWWGSMQYDPAYKDYAKYFELRKSGKSMDAALAELGYEFEHLGVKEPYQIRDSLIAELDEFKVIDEDDDIIDREVLLEASSVEDLFEWAKGCSWDLWSAASTIFEHSFVGADLIEIDSDASDHSEAVEGWPILNQMLIMSESTRTGLSCAILVDSGLVKDASCFEGFDT